MLPSIRGPTQWAVILCRFNDIPPLNIPNRKFFDLVSEYGTGGLFDYWRNVSYDAISLAGSEMYGWYTMKYSFVRDGLDPLKDGGRTPVRLAWINEAKRLAQENGVELSRFYGVIAVVNAKVDDSNIGRDMVLSVGGAWGQTNWRWCNKCQGLAYGGNPSPGACPRDGVHDHSGSFDYTLANFVQDRTFLIQSDLQPGEIFKDDQRRVRISIDSIDSNSSLATITINTPITIPHHSIPNTGLVTSKHYTQ